MVSDYSSRMDSKSTRQTPKRELRPLTPMGNGFVYQGEWSIITNQRDGRGVQIWPNGSRYDGWWLNDSASGYGRLV